MEKLAEEASHTDDHHRGPLDRGRDVERASQEESEKVREVRITAAAPRRENLHYAVATFLDDDVCHSLSTLCMTRAIGRSGVYAIASACFPTDGHCGAALGTAIQPAYCHDARRGPCRAPSLQAAGRSRASARPAHAGGDFVYVRIRDGSGISASCLLLLLSYMLPLSTPPASGLLRKVGASGRGELSLPRPCPPRTTPSGLPRSTPPEILPPCRSFNGACVPGTARAYSAQEGREHPVRCSSASMHVR
jgi:hypothetical protein